MAPLFAAANQLPLPTALQIVHRVCLPYCYKDKNASTKALRARKSCDSTLLNVVASFFAMSSTDILSTYFSVKTYVYLGKILANTCWIFSESIDASSSSSGFRSGETNASSRGA